MNDVYYNMDDFRAAQNEEFDYDEKKEQDDWCERCGEFHEREAGKETLPEMGEARSEMGSTDEGSSS